uniref:EGF-like domain-containing protein n=1 Tax=Monopterus albus TaxID=43700 RepID=A0A3Q3IH02_MONAL
VIDFLFVFPAAALALYKYCLAEWNATDESANPTVSYCHRHGNRDNCTDLIDTRQENSHFSKCPEKQETYCVHGECRYIIEHEAPSCRCEPGYIGSRCEYVDLDPQIAENRQIIIAGVIAGLLILTLLIVFICIFLHRRSRLCRRRGRRREEPRNGTEKHSMSETRTHSETHTPLTSDSTEPPHTDAV